MASLFNSELKYKNKNHSDSEILNIIKLGETLVPSIPFLWYREEQLICPIEYIYKISWKNIKNLFNPNNLIPDQENIYLIIQKNILENSNIYICTHAYLYSELNKNNNKILDIPENFNINIPAEIKINFLDILNYKSDFILVNSGLRENIPNRVPVFIHNRAFSPPGIGHIKINKNNLVSGLFSEIKINNSNIKMVFIIITDINNNPEINNILFSLRCDNIYTPVPDGPNQ